MFRATLLTTALLAAAPAATQDFLDLGELVLSPSAVPVEAARTGADVETLTAGEIAATGEPLLLDVLRTLPGVSATRNGPPGSTATLRVRGFGPQYVATRIDGIDVSDPSNVQVQFDFGGLPTFGTGGIEVLKGSQSALYGSEAIAGVVAIRTFGAAPGTTARVEAGGNDSYAAGIAGTREGATGRFAFALDHVRTDGFSATAPGTEADGFETTRLSYALEERVGDVTLGVALFAQTEENEFDEFGGDGATPFDEVATRDQVGVRLSARFETGIVENEVAVQLFDVRRTSDSTTDFGFTDSRFEGRREGVEYRGDASLSDTLALSFGADLTRETFSERTATAAGVDRSEEGVTIMGAFAELRAAPRPDLDLSAALRVDEHSTAGTFASGRLAAAWRPDEATVIRASIGNGFRAPSLYEIGSTLYGNPALEPERSRSVDVGIERALPFGAVSAGLFYVEVDDLVEFVTLTAFPQPFTGEYQQSDGTSQTGGVELAGEAAIAGGRLYGSYTYTDAEGPDGGPLLRVPEHTLVLGAERAIGARLDAGLQVRHASGAFDATFPAPTFARTVVPLDDYTVADLLLSYDVTDTAEAYLRVENLLDEQYEVIDGFNTPDRTVHVGLRASF